MDFLFILSGLVLLFFGGEGLVRGSVGLAERMGISTLLVSLVIIGFGTSAPELLVCIQAALNGVPDMALGNAVGSNIANTLLILGVGATIAPLACDKIVIRRDCLAVIAASLLLVGLSLFGGIDWRAGSVMIVLLLGYLYSAYYMEKTAVEPEKGQDKELHDHIAEDVGDPKDSVLKAALFVFVGLLFLVGGANLLVTGASSIARSFGISEAIIGLSLIALGTSLPELATAVVAAMRGHSDVIIGNVLGSNLFNILSILGVTSLIAPLSMEGRIAEFDVWIMLASAIILYPIIRTGRKISRFEGISFLVLYVGYIGMMYVT